MPLFDWAFDVAQEKLARALPRRWAHVQGVACRARSLAEVVGRDADLLEAAAILHDIGYAPDLVKTNFHPLDGAIFLEDIRAPKRIVNLVAHHSYARLEADLRGLADRMNGFDDEHGITRDALWYCDQTTSPDGEEVKATNRIIEIKSRYGPGNLVTKFISEASSELLAAVARTEYRMIQSD